MNPIPAYYGAKISDLRNHSQSSLALLAALLKTNLSTIR